MDQNDRTREFTPDELALAQHLANQIGVALKLLDQRSVREQLFRTEKLAAVGRLISGVVNELQSPLSSIAQLADQEQTAPGADPRIALNAIMRDARRGADIVNRLVAFAGSEQTEAKPVDINPLLRNLVEFREREWKSRGIRVRELMAEQPQVVLGSQGQLEQVFLNLLLYAEHGLAQAREKVIVIKSSRLMNRVLVEINYSNPVSLDPFADAADETAGALDASVCRGIIAGHGGELRTIRKPGAHCGFEIELPWARRDVRISSPAGPRPQRDRAQPYTALVIDPDDAFHRQFLALLSARNFRVVPVKNADTGLDLAQRMRFDAAFCSVHAPGLNWVELSEQLQNRVGVFVLLCDGFDSELAADFEGEGRFVLPKPIDESQLDRILQGKGSEAIV